MLHVDGGVGGHDDGGAFTRSERGGEVGTLGAGGCSRGCRRGRHGGRWSGGLREMAAGGKSDGLRKAATGGAATP